MCITGAILGSAVIGGIGANKAAKSQEKAAKNQIQYSEDTRDMIMELNQPFVDSGYAANNALNYLAGIADKPENYAGFQATPGYEFRLNQGLDAVGGMASANGMLNSGATMKALNDYAQGQASSEYANHLNLLSGLAGSGQNAASGQATALTNNNQMVNNAYGSIGNAQAAGAVGTANALTGGITNGVSLWNYQNAMNGGNALFGGNSWG